MRAFHFVIKRSNTDIESQEENFKIIIYFIVYIFIAKECIIAV